MPDRALILRCLEELESELLRVGVEHCDHLRQENQLSAVVLLLLRASSLFRSMVELYRQENLDGFDAVRRAFLETWFLAFQLRLREAAGDVGRWLGRAPQSWTADIARLERYARQRGHAAPNLGRAYGGLSGLAHPTRDAAENSTALITQRRGINIEAAAVNQAFADLATELTQLLYKLIWLALDEDTGFIALPVIERNMPDASRFVEEQQVQQR